MAVESLASGFQNGYDWTVDHDDQAGTIGVTVTDEGTRQAGTLSLHAQVFSSAGVLLGEITPIRIDTFDGQGRQILFTNNSLKHISLVVDRGQQQPAFGLNIWTTFQPA